MYFIIWFNLLHANKYTWMTTENNINSYTASFFPLNIGDTSFNSFHDMPQKYTNQCKTEFFKSPRDLYHK